MSAGNDYDVVVIGGGGAGMAAAIEASDAGASVALLEADAVSTPCSSRKAAR